MCGRYTLFTPATDLEARFDADFAGVEPRYNCAPGQDLPVIADEDPTVATRMEWGLTPWADESFDLINARAETVSEKRSFADAFERRRCLVPADGFYEWVDGGGPDSDVNRGGGGTTPTASPSRTIDCSRWRGSTSGGSRPNRRRRRRDSERSAGGAGGRRFETTAADP